MWFFGRKKETNRTERVGGFESYDLPVKDAGGRLVSQPKGKTLRLGHEDSSEVYKKLVKFRLEIIKMFRSGLQVYIKDDVENTQIRAIGVRMDEPSNPHTRKMASISYEDLHELGWGGRLEGMVSKGLMSKKEAETIREIRDAVIIFQITQAYKAFGI